MTSTTTLLGCNLALLPSLLTCRRSSRPTSTATAISSRLPTFRTAGFRSNPRVVNVRSQSEGASGSPKTEDKKPNTEEEPTPSWAKAGSEELPPWARNEAAAPSKVESADLPFFVYLVASCLVAIAAVRHSWILLSISLKPQNVILLTFAHLPTLPAHPFWKRNHGIICENLGELCTVDVIVSRDFQISRSRSHWGEFVTSGCAWFGNPMLFSRVELTLQKLQPHSLCKIKGWKHVWDQICRWAIWWLQEKFQ